MSDTPYYIHGLQGGIHPRLEVRELAKLTEQWTLFNLSLQEIQRADHKPVAAKFLSLGGIHGLPYERWSGDPKGDSKSISDEWGGYCNHESILFPTWHRPFILAIEQSIGETAIDIANDLTRSSSSAVKEVWMAAARQLRWPYWDWTDERTAKEGLPDLLRPRAVVLKLPNGGSRTLSTNPLATYHFEDPRPNGFQNIDNDARDPWNPWAPIDKAYFKDWTSSYRWPTSTVNPKEEYYRQDILLKNDDYGWKSLKTAVGLLFSFPSDADKDEYPFIWDEFSNTRFQSKGTKAARKMKDYKAGNLEQPHNKVHLDLGGLGHMANNDYAGFDPIFYLHHTNVDRIYAFWEYVYPNYWMGQGYYDEHGKLVKFVQPGGSYSEKPDAAIDETSVLEPFRTDSNAYWTSKDTHGLLSTGRVYKGYTYALTEGRVTIDVSKPSTEAQRKKFLTTLQQYFGFNIHAIKTAYEGSYPIVRLLRGIAEPPQSFKEVSDYRHFIIVADILEHAYNGSYKLEILYNNTHVGAVSCLSRGFETQCANCQGRRDVGNRVHGTISVHHHVMEQIYSLFDETHTEDAFGEVIKRSFSARLVGPTGVVLATASNDVDPTPDNALPEEKRPNITIHSAAAAVHEEHGNYVLFDDKEYGKILEGKWVVIPLEQRVQPN